MCIWKKVGDVVRNVLNSFFVLKFGIMDCRFRFVLVGWDKCVWMWVVLRLLWRNFMLFLNLLRWFDSMVEILLVFIVRFLVIVLLIVLIMYLFVK